MGKWISDYGGNLHPSYEMICTGLALRHTKVLAVPILFEHGSSWDREYCLI